ncbi:lysis system i-spanin subunit Rz [Pseudomonas quasicaspiana]|uniref:lysis system i-spanin subunit Rz n=1 Tax=Pseudomonas quasicaspiana TaxID=2829821 RepID=UPI001E2A89D3|nr:lysis system i-spanin subunit Rz [Pseudomonas quasicaspiana]MCD5970429.1 lysis protein [Pseudomonas quasicaspiana]
MTIAPLRLALLLLLASLLSYVLFDRVSDQRDVAIRERDSAVSERNGLREAARISGEMLASRDAIDLKRTQELNNALDDNKALQLAVTTGSSRLYVNARCPAAVPSTAATSSLANAGSAELAADARPDYFTLRDQLALSKQMILGLQDYIRQVVQRTPAKP